MVIDFWQREPVLGKCFVLVAFTIVGFAAVRFMRLAGKLCSYSGDSLSPERITTGDIEADVLAKYALSHRTPLNSASEDKSEFTDRAARLNQLSLGECQFVYLSEICAADVESTKQSAWLMLLLSLLTIASRAMPTFESNFNDANVSAWYALHETFNQLLTVFGSELSACAMIYILSGFFERKLRIRRAEWNYFFARAKQGG